jgi:hypothetical protein
MNRLLPIAKKIAIAALVALVITYAVDYISLHLRMRKPTPTDPFESVSIDRMYAILQKSGKSEFVPADTINVTCVHSLFPHSGYNPCWYVERQKDQTIPMVILPPASRHF